MLTPAHLAVAALWFRRLPATAGGTIQVSIKNTVRTLRLGDHRTVRRALAALERDGVVERLPGKPGVITLRLLDRPAAVRLRSSIPRGRKAYTQNPQVAHRRQSARNQGGTGGPRRPSTRSTGPTTTTRVVSTTKNRSRAVDSVDSGDNLRHPAGPAAPDEPNDGSVVHTPHTLSTRRPK